MFKNYNRLALIEYLYGQPVPGFTSIAHLAHRDRDAQTRQEVADGGSGANPEPAQDVVAGDAHPGPGPPRETGESASLPPWPCPEPREQ
ncbi:MAG TPA: hypothetical protein VFA98_07115, partial [Thermoanaerobaculia bacterium]|nr:hypothetical protein [Thermoanaerobaculia bacterium]